MIKVELKKVNLTRSIIEQIPLITIPRTLNFEVLGWVSLRSGKIKFSILKIADVYRKAHVIKKTDIISEQTYDGSYRLVKSISIIRWDGSTIPLVIHDCEEQNELKKKIVDKLIKDTEKAGQIFY